MVAERIRSMVAASALAVGDSRLSLTISVGVGETMAGLPGVEAVLRDADQALYDAKANGRNIVCVAKRLSRTVLPAAA